MTSAPARYETTPEHLRRRDVTWHASRHARTLAAGMTGLEIMRAIRDGTLPEPPMARLMGFRCVIAEPGEVSMRLSPDESLENPMGTIHGGVAATMLDTAMGAAAQTRLPVDAAIVTLDLTITYLKPLTIASGAITATGRVVQSGGRSVYVVGEVHDGRGDLTAHAVGNFSIVRPRSREA